MNLNLDKAVAANVKKLREKQGLSTAELASRLGVGRHVVRDYERPRKGTQQRQFLWEEVVNLCAAFNVTIFELVLPEEGRRTVPAEWEHLPLVIPQVVEGGSDEMKAHWRRDDRRMLLDVLIGPDVEPKHIKSLASMKRQREEQLIKELKSLLSETGEDQ